MALILVATDVLEETANTALRQRHQRFHRSAEHLPGITGEGVLVHNRSTAARLVALGGYIAPSGGAGG
jgi:hypothetical protein